MKNSKSKKLLYSINTKDDKKLRLYISIASVVTAMVMVAIGWKIVPIKELYDAGSLAEFVWRAVAVILGMAACLAAHEGIHILMLRKLHGHSTETGFDKAYPYIGCKDYFEKRSYILLSLAPVAIIFVILLVLLLVVPESWFWVVYIILILNISGSIGDFYCAYKLLIEKENIRIKDDGKTVEIQKK